MYKQDKFPYDITVGITFRTDKKIPVKFLEIIFKNNKQKHYPLIISWNLHILTKCSFIDNCVIIIFQKKNNFPVTAHDLIFYLKHAAVWIPEVFCKKGFLKNLENFTGKHLCWSLILVKLCATAPVQYSFLVCSLYMPQYKKQKPQLDLF